MNVHVATLLDHALPEELDALRYEFKVACVLEEAKERATMLTSQVGRTQ